MIECHLDVVEAVGLSPSSPIKGLSILGGLLFYKKEKGGWINEVHDFVRHS